MEGTVRPLSPYHFELVVMHCVCKTLRAFLDHKLSQIELSRHEKAVYWFLIQLCACDAAPIFCWCCS